MNGLCNASVLVVVILMALVTASKAFASPPTKARIAKTKTELGSLLAALQMYNRENGNYPSASQGLLALIEKPDGKPEPLNWPEGGYLDRIPKDPWGRHYTYRNPGVADPVEVYSFGRDGKPGGCGENADLYSSHLENVDSNKCKLLELRQSIFNWILYRFIPALILIYLIRKLFKNGDGDSHIILRLLFACLVALILAVMFRPVYF